MTEHEHITAARTALRRWLWKEYAKKAALVLGGLLVGAFPTLRAWAEQVCR